MRLKFFLLFVLFLFVIEGVCAECSEGEKKCEGGNVVVCVNNEFILAEECKEGCNQGECFVPEEKDEGMGLFSKILIGGSILPAILILIVIIGWLVNKLSPDRSMDYKKKCVRCDAKIKSGQDVCHKCGMKLKQ